MTSRNTAAGCATCNSASARQERSWPISCWDTRTKNKPGNWPPSCCNNSPNSPMCCTRLSHCPRQCALAPQSSNHSSSRAIAAATSSQSSASQPRPSLFKSFDESPAIVAAFGLIVDFIHEMMDQEQTIASGLGFIQVGRLDLGQIERLAGVVNVDHQTARLVEDGQGKLHSAWKVTIGVLNNIRARFVHGQHNFERARLPVAQVQLLAE